MQLSALTFQRQFSRFDEQIRGRSGEPFRSFAEGLPARFEDYKGDVRREAIRRLGSGDWSVVDVGEGRILSRVIAAIEINEPNPRPLRNNLVAWQNRFGPEARSHRALLDAQANPADRRRFDQWFLDFFDNRIADNEAFDTFLDLIDGRQYDLVAYLFFLKDWNRFMPVAPRTFDKAFRFLGIDLVTSRRCSWENYVGYNAALAEVRRALQEIARVADARLIDAHSFCWMLARIELPEASPVPVIPLPEVVSDLEAIAALPPSDDQDREFGEMDDALFAERDAERRSLGRLAQDIAFQSEKRRLREVGLANPDEAVRPVWNEPGRGFDILSSEVDGTERQIEVKAARRSGNRLSFFVTRNEWNKSRTLSNYFFYLVLDVKSLAPKVLMIESGRLAEYFLAPMNYLASLRMADT